MIYLKTDEEIELLRENNILVSKTLAEVGRHIRPGVTTKFLDSVAEDFIRAHGAVPAFLGYQGFPASLCISVNEQVVHGIPSSKCVLREGDIVSVDCGTFMKGFVGDSAYTFAVGEVAGEVRQLMEVTKEALYKGTAQAKAGNRVGDVSAAVQSTPKVSATVWCGNWKDMGWVGKCTKTPVSPITEHAAGGRSSRKEWSSVSSP